MSTRAGADFWSARLAHLAALGHLDAIAIVLLGQSGLATYVAHNVSQTAWDGAANEALQRVVTTGSPEQLRNGAVHLADGRAADTLLVAPIVWRDRIAGALAAFVAERAVQDGDLATLTRLGQLAGLELAEANAMWQSTKQTQEFEARLHQAEEDRKQAMVLFELSRLATLGADVQNDLESAAMMLCGTLGHDAVGIWAHAEHRLRLRASTGFDKTKSDVPIDESDTVLATVLREKRAARGSFAELRSPPAWAPPGCASYLVTPIGALGVLVAGRATGTYTEDDADFSVNVGEYLVGLLQRSTSTDVVDQGVSAERRKIAQELHDGLAQELTGVVLALEGCQRALDKDPALLGPQLAKASRDARATLMDVRQYMTALRQSETGGLNLPVTLGRLVDDLRRQTGLHVVMEESGDARALDAIVERAVIRIVGEALRNVAQHAGASTAKVALLYGQDGVVVTVEDDGKGFDVDETFRGAEDRGHFGVVGMRERAEAAGGHIVVRSEPGRGSIVRASIPYASDAAVPVNYGRRATDRLPAEAQAEAHEATADRAGFFSRLFGR
ncbi:MAG TPA: sensor histidine kinase [Candidatus Limnocylindria bacterium]|nr:sensor histidine kinase [Candidatus Limnocylindria bacterium]